MAIPPVNDSLPSSPPPGHSLRFDAISKSFPGVKALDGVSFDVHGGTVHALMGENGAGKSTLLKILSGAYSLDTGRLLIDGQSRQFASTSAAIHAGVSVIYQELHLVPELSVAENLYLGRLPNSAGWVHSGPLITAARQTLEALGEDVNPRTKIRSLPIAQRQMVEIAKALARNAQVIAFDEPTSSLSDREVDRLFTVITKLRAEGRVILYVTHRMDEVFRLCDAATVLRDGRHVQSFPSLKDVTRDDLVSRMVGRSIKDVFQYSPRPQLPSPNAMDVENIAGKGLAEPASFSVARGEILGIFGLVGAGRSELLKLIYGGERPTQGRVSVEGVPAHIPSPAHAIRNGIVLCPEDRKKEGIIPIRSVMENLNLSGRRHFSLLKFIINNRRERENARSYVKKLSIRTPSLQQLIMNLSGGNQQKVILARWLSENLKVILLDEPTRGIDVGAKSEIYAITYELASRGIGVVAVSSELPEVMGISDRLLVMRQGRIVANLKRGEATAAEILRLALPVQAFSSHKNLGAIPA